MVVSESGLGLFGTEKSRRGSEVSQWYRVSRTEEWKRTEIIGEVKGDGDRIRSGEYRTGLRHNQRLNRRTGVRSGEVK